MRFKQVQEWRQSAKARLSTWPHPTLRLLDPLSTALLSTRRLVGFLGNRRLGKHIDRSKHPYRNELTLEPCDTIQLRTDRWDRSPVDAVRRCLACAPLPDREELSPRPRGRVHRAA